MPRALVSDAAHQGRSRRAAAPAQMLRPRLRRAAAQCICESDEFMARQCISSCTKACKARLDGLHGGRHVEHVWPLPRRPIVRLCVAEVQVLQQLDVARADVQRPRQLWRTRHAHAVCRHRARHSCTQGGVHNPHSKRNEFWHPLHCYVPARAFIQCVPPSAPPLHCNSWAAKSNSDTTESVHHVAWRDGPAVVQGSTPGGLQQESCASPQVPGSVPLPSSRQVPLFTQTPRLSAQGSLSRGNTPGTLSAHGTACAHYMHLRVGA